MKKYKLLKDWEGSKAGTVGVLQDNGNLGFKKTYKNTTWVIHPNHMDDAIKDGLIEEVEEERFSEYKQHCKQVIDRGVGAVSDSFFIGDESKSIEVLNYHDGSIEISITEYGNEQTKMLTVDETQGLINWMINYCTTNK